jgi:hypothetical protein
MRSITPEADKSLLDHAAAQRVHFGHRATS